MTEKLLKLLKILLTKCISYLGLVGILSLIIFCTFAYYKAQQNYKHIITSESEETIDKTEVKVECLKLNETTDIKKDLLKPYITTKTEVLALFSKYNPPYIKAQNCLEYVFGWCNGVHYEYLYVCFNEDDKVTSVYTDRASG